MIPDHPPDVPAYEDESPIQVGFDQERCGLCGQTSVPPDKAVADFPDPSGGGDPRGRQICIDCYVDELEKFTPLSGEKAKVFGLMLAGYSHDQIATAVGQSELDIERLSKEIWDQRQGQEALAGLFQYL